MDIPVIHRTLSSLNRDKHAKFLSRHLGTLPSSTTDLDTSRLTVAFFSISGLGLLDALDQYSDTEKQALVDWIYSLQVNHSLPENLGKFGFRGSSANDSNHIYDHGHLAMTYSALASLLVLGDDLSRVNRSLIAQNMSQLQLPDGSFAAVHGSESDMRFVYCAAAICYILDDWSPINIPKVLQFISNSLSYEGAFGQGPGNESHGGSTYCAVASLILMNKLNEVLNGKQIHNLKRWLVMKQVSGFQGRPNKEPDTCYSFWIGATLKLLNCHHLINEGENVDFILSTEDLDVGGLAKYPSNFPDILHTFFGLSALALMDGSWFESEEKEKERIVATPLSIDAAINIPSKYSISGKKLAL